MLVTLCLWLGFPVYVKIFSASVRVSGSVCVFLAQGCLGVAGLLLRGVRVYL